MTAAGEVVTTVDLLGPFAVSVNGRPVRVSAGRLRAVLAVLAMSPGDDVSIDRLAGAVWGEDLPADARRTVQIYVARLRGALGPTAIGTAADGYRLRTCPDRVDATRFARLLDAAARCTDPATERARLVEALGLWRGTPFTGVPSTSLHTVESTWLVERHLAALERRIDLDLAAGDADGELVGELHRLTATHPLRERLWGQLMTVLYRSGRQADALDAYRRLYRVTDAELGVEPGPAVRDLHGRILRADPALDGPTAERAAEVPVPRQLPPRIRHFTGRSDCLDRLDALLTDAGPATVVIAGAAGIGKTALAVDWAHRVAHRFGDGQLYVNLRGFDPSGQAVPAAEAVRGFLHALGVPPRGVPADPQAQAGLYRSLLAGRRMLVLLDNARDTGQVRPLLPAEPGCATVITSRNRLVGLVAGEGARLLTLDVLSPAESRRFLAARLGADRVAAQPDAVDGLVARCGGLPLALAVVAARAVANPAFPLAAVLDDLADARGRLDALVGESAVADVRAVFSWSYHALTADAARLFRQLALHPGPEVSAPPLASLTGTTVPEIRPLLAELAAGHMTVETAPGRYAVHDLLRAYAAELLAAHETDDDRRRRTHRLLDHYLHSALAAGGVLHPHRDHPVTPAPALPGVVPEAFGGLRPALEWMTAELPTLLATVPLAADSGFDTHAWQLAWALAAFLGRLGRWHDSIATQRVALRAVQRLGDPTGQARTHRGLARAYRQTGRFDVASAHLREARRRYAGLGDDVGLGHTDNSLGQVFAEQGRYAEALPHALRAVDLLRRAGDVAGEALALNGAGWCHAKLGDHRRALARCEEALALQRRLGDRYGEGTTQDSLGYIHHLTGDLAKARACYERALALRGEGGDRRGVATSLTGLGDTCHRAGDHAAARVAWRRALAVLAELDEPRDDAVRIRLDPLGRST